MEFPLLASLWVAVLLLLASALIAGTRFRKALANKLANAGMVAVAVVLLFFVGDRIVTTNMVARQLIIGPSYVAGGCYLIYRSENRSPGYLLGLMGTFVGTLFLLSAIGDWVVSRYF